MRTTTMRMTTMTTTTMIEIGPTMVMTIVSLIEKIEVVQRTVPPSTAQRFAPAARVLLPMPMGACRRPRCRGEGGPGSGARVPARV
jgi:hypothetical protein